MYIFNVLSKYYKNILSRILIIFNELVMVLKLNFSTSSENTAIKCKNKLNVAHKNVFKI